MAVVSTHGSAVAVERGTPDAVAASPTVGPGVVVVGAVSEDQAVGGARRG